MKKIIVIVWILVMVFGAVEAQPYNIGDKVDDIPLKLLNYKSKKARLKNFEGKPLVIHFWNQGCNESMKMFVRLKGMMKEYSDRITIIGVTFETTETVEMLLRTKPEMMGTVIPIIAGDSVFYKWFPHRGEPYEVWIDGKGVVQAMSISKYLNEENVQRFISTGSITLPLKKSEMDKDAFMNYQPLMKTAWGKYDESIQEYRFIGGHMPAIVNGGTYKRNAKTGLVRISLTNRALWDFYKVAYDRVEMHESRIFFSRRNDFLPDEETGANLYCYDLVVRAETMQKGYDYMKTDIEKYFGFKGRLQTMKVKCMVLKLAAEGLPGTSNNEEGSKVYFTDSTKVFKNMRVRNLSLYLTNNTRYMVIDETGYKEPIDVAVPKELQDIRSIQVMLARYGFSLTEEERDMEVLMIE